MGKIKYKDVSERQKCQTITIKKVKDLSARVKENQTLVFREYSNNSFKFFVQ